MRVQLLATIPAVLLLVSAPSAQVPGGAGAPPSTGSVVIKGKAPVSEEMLRVKLPRPAEVDLPNGIHLMVL